MTGRALAALLGIAVPCLAAAQDPERCVFTNTPNTRQESTRLPSGEYNTFIGGGVRGRCAASNLILNADSLESYGDEGRIYLVGHVHYEEPRLQLTSDFLTYYQKAERILARQNVVARLPSGSTLRGPMLDYYRSVPVSRPAARILATNRPTITIVQKDSLGQPADTMTVIANTITSLGDSLVWGSGAVVMTRPDVEATGDSLEVDTEAGLLVLLRGPSITTRKDRPFTLTGVRIELTSKNKKIERILAMGQGKAVSEDMTLASDTIDLRVADNLLQRAIAWGPSRASATSTTQKIVSDSIDVFMPGQRIREMHAVRGAAAEGKPDTTRFRADTVDWLRGDTIIARFEPETARSARDTNRTAQLRELVARGNSRSRYHLAPSDSSLRVPAINYVTGRNISVAFRQRRASVVTVQDKATGIYLDPKPVAKPATDTKTTTKTTTKTPAPITPPSIPAPPARPPR